MSDDIHAIEHNPQEKIARLRQLLDDERVAIRSGDFATLATLVSRKEAEIAGLTDLPPTALAPLRREIEENQRLVEAALSGLRAARHRIEQIIASVKTCVTYDKNGQPCRLNRDVAIFEKRA